MKLRASDSLVRVADARSTPVGAPEFTMSDGCCARPAGGQPVRRMGTMPNETGRRSPCAAVPPRRVPRKRTGST
jgi:hypothetical protein